MKSIASLFYTALLVMLISPAYAHDPSQANAGFCQDAQTTADLVGCTARHLDAENMHMKVLYDHLIRVLPDEDISALRESQKDWIVHRDDLCATESAAYTGGSLARVQDLSCHARVTGERSSHLEALLIPYDRDVIPTFSAPARWTNVLIDDYPQTYWALADEKYADADCDDTDEIIVSGMKFGAEDEIVPVTAIIKQGQTGRPHVQILNFDDKKNCGLARTLKITPAPFSKPDLENSDEIRQCKHILVLETARCGNFMVSLDRETDSYTVSTVNNNKENQE